MGKICDYMQDPLLSIDADSTVHDAAKFMLDHKVGGLLVKENDDYVGIVTDVDFTRKVVAAGLDPDATKISAIMSHPLVILDSHREMSEAFSCMRQNHVRHILITEKEKIIGMISVRDFANYYNAKYGQGKDPIAEFWNNYDALLVEGIFVTAVERLLKDFRKTLSNSSKTAISMDNREDWGQIAQHAREEGLHDLAEILSLAEN